MEPTRTVVPVAGGATSIWETPNSSSAVGAVTITLTQQDDNAEKDGDQSPRAETHGEKYGLGAAGQQRAVRFTAAYSDGQGASGALGGVAVIFNDHGQEVDLLQAASEAAPLRHDSSCVVWNFKKEKRNQKESLKC